MVVLTVVSLSSAPLNVLAVATDTPAPTDTATPTPTDTPTDTPTPTATPTDTPSSTPTDTPTDTPTPTPTATPTDTPSPTPTDAPTPTPGNPGSITVCKMIVDAAGNPSDGHEVSNTTFTESSIFPVTGDTTPPATAAYGPTSWTTPLTFNTKLLAASDGNDANCVTYSDLALGSYYYGQENITGAGSNWLTPLYNDQYETAVTSLESFFSYDPSLFNADPSDDAVRIQDADGHLNLTAERPSRTIVVLNRLPETFRGSITVCKILLDGVPCDPGADEVVSYTPGLNSVGGTIASELPARNDPSAALGTPENNDTNNFVSLGFGGSIVLKFNNYIVNGAGDDVALTETTFGNQSCAAYPEKVHAYASQDGVTWTDIGTGCQDSTFDLGPLSWAHYIKLVDISDINDPVFANKIAHHELLDGFDVDGVMAIHCSNFSPDTRFTIQGLFPQTGDSTPAATWSFPDTTFTMPLVYNADLLFGDKINDAQCYTYDNLPLGSYYYGEELVSPSYNFLSPLYNDTYDFAGALALSLGDFFPWSPHLYNGNPSDDGDRNQNSDGHLNLTEDRPNRTIIVLNQVASGSFTPTPTPTESVSPTPTPTPECDGQCSGPSDTPTPTPTTYTLTVTTSGEGTGTVDGDGINCISNDDSSDCTQTYPDGTEVTLTATPDEGSSFVGTWSGACTGDDPVCVITMNADLSVNAHFTLTGSPTPTPITPNTFSSLGGGGGGGGGGGAVLSSPSPTPVIAGVSTNNSEPQEVAGVSTTLPDTGASGTDRFLMTFFATLVAMGVALMFFGTLRYVRSDR